jgi:2-phospho-L-lactate transferase/gluconeogenesis factor (CofD/UPF0052 family)
MTQPGETEGYTVADHIRAIDAACGERRLFDAVLIHKKSPSEQSLIRYAEQNSHPVFLDREAVTQLGRRIVLANVLYEDETGVIRHNPQKLAQVLLRWYGRGQSLRGIQNSKFKIQN